MIRPDPDGRLPGFAGQQMDSGMSRERDGGRPARPHQGRRPSLPRKLLQAVIFAVLAFGALAFVDLSLSVISPERPARVAGMLLDPLLRFLGLLALGV